MAQTAIQVDHTADGQIGITYKKDGKIVHVSFRREERDIIIDQIDEWVKKGDISVKTALLFAHIMGRESA
jgi:uncharacterized protein YuzE